MLVHLKIYRCKYVQISNENHCRHLNFKAQATVETSTEDDVVGDHIKDKSLGC